MADESLPMLSGGPVETRLPNINISACAGTHHMGSGIHPHAIQLSDGIILAVFTEVVDMTYFRLTVVRSEDRGKTWVPDGFVAKKAHLDEGYLLQLPNGRVLCAFCNIVRNTDINTVNHTVGNVATHSTIELYFSDSLGRDWTYQTTFDEITSSLKNPILHIMNDGVLRMYYCIEDKRSQTRSCALKMSSDGETWDETGRIGGFGLDTSPCGMLSLTIQEVKRYDQTYKHLVALFEVGWHGEIVLLKSHNGLTWQMGWKLPRAVRSHAPVQIVKCGENLALIYERHINDQNSDLVLTTKRPRIKVTCGWRYGKSIVPANSQLGALLALNGSQLLVMFGNGGLKARYISLHIPVNQGMGHDSLLCN